ncbi:MAG TPA: hypothetical protein VHB21_12975 [Minicystis sp.]|nr:hypothetical protein [Minicystis sp.]
MSNANDDAFPADALSSFDAVPGREVAWWPGVPATLTAFFAGASDISVWSASRLGPNGLRVYPIDASVLPRLAAVPEPRRDFAERVSRFSADCGHAVEHDEPLKLTPREYAELPLETLRARTTRLEDLEPRYRDVWQKRFDEWHEAIEGLAAFAPEVGAGQELYCVVWRDPGLRPPSQGIVERELHP